MKIKYVAQKQEHGCVVACIAMVLGWEYQEVRDYFLNDFDKRGVDSGIAKTFICERGFSVIEKRPEGFTDIRSAKQRMLEPFAPVHIVSGAQFIDVKEGHSVVMDGKGKILNPGNRQRIDAMADYYSIDRVFGFWSEIVTPKRKQKK